MNTIVTTDNAETFVEKLNENFVEAASSGGSGSSESSDHSVVGETLVVTGASGTERTVYVDMQGGMMDSGYTKGAITTTTQFFRYMHSVLMMCIDGCSISSVTLDSGETLTVFYYGADGSYLGSVASVDDIPSTACYVKFQVYKSSNYTAIRHLAVTVAGTPTFHKNGVPTLVANKFISFETVMPVRLETSASDSDVNSYVGNNTRLYDNGFIKLPPNYTIDGAPVPLVIFVHGTGGYSFSGGPSSLYTDLQSFIVNNGYALCDCSGLTNAYSSVANSFAAPSMEAAITNMVKFLVANYNIKDDGVYIYGKSSGGFVTHLLAQHQPFKIRAVGSLAPALSPMVSMAHHARTYTATATMEATQVGVNYTFTSSQFSSADQAAMTDNVDKWREIDPMFAGTDVTDDEVATIVAACYAAGGSSYHLNISDVSAATTILNEKKRWVPVPTKIWIAADDATVFLGNSQLYCDMAQRAGSPCYLRVLPSGTGQHHAVDTSDSAVMATYQTKYAGSVSVAAAYAEMVDWFNRN